MLEPYVSFEKQYRGNPNYLFCALSWEANDNHKYLDVHVNDLTSPLAEKLRKDPYFEGYPVQVKLLDRNDARFAGLEWPGRWPQ